MTRFHLASSSPLFIALALNLAACVIDKDLGDTPGDSSGATATTSGTTTDPGTGTSDPTEGVPALCPDNPRFTCSVAYTCMGFPCGGLQDWLDADGCPRLPCGVNDEPCPTGQVCYQSGLWGECNSSGIFCEDFDGVCECGEPLDCTDVSYCVPAEIGPPLDCGAITDAQACEDAGCSEASTVTPLTLVDDACVCGESEVACLWFPPGVEIGSTASPAPFYRKSTLEVVMFPGNWFDPPHGWASCEGDLAAPPACACADTCSP